MLLCGNVLPFGRAYGRDTAAASDSTPRIPPHPMTNTARGFLTIRVHRSSPQRTLNRRICTMGAAAAPQFDTYSAPSGPNVIPGGTDNPVITSQLTRASAFTEAQPPADSRLNSSLCFNGELQREVMRGETKADSKSRSRCDPVR